MIDIVPLTYLPQEQFTLASDHEAQEAHRYRQLAHDVHILFPDTSRLMMAFGIMSLHRLASLQAVAERLGMSACVTIVEAQKRDWSLATCPKEFIVNNDGMLVKILEQARTDAQLSWKFSLHMLETNSTPELEFLLLTFTEQKQKTASILRLWNNEMDEISQVS